MWTNENRARYDRSHLRYPSDLTDDEWKLVEPLIPPGKRGGDKRTVIMREVVNGLMYILSTGCQWRAIPKDLPPRSTLYDYFDLWSWDGTLDLIHHELYVKCREAIGREASPTAAVIDSQSVKGAEKGGPSIDPPGYDAGKKIRGKKRHILVDTQGLLIHAIVHAADIQDRDGGVFVMATMFGMYPFLMKLYADGGYQGPLFRRAVAKIMARVNVEIVKRSDHAKGFVALPKRWVVERTFAWLGRCRRLAKDWENLNRKALAFLRLASIRLMLRKLCNPA
ncbi:MAG TPA: IS5 family transposase [Steroidobacteraceae bacterium]|nr:IS5 family transposase [Steroidobacteraceae bacterium]